MYSHFFYEMRSDDQIDGGAQSCWGAGVAVFIFLCGTPDLPQSNKDSFLSMVLASNNLWEALWIDVQPTGVTNKSYNILPLKMKKGLQGQHSRCQLVTAAAIMIMVIITLSYRLLSKSSKLYFNLYQVTLSSI